MITDKKSILLASVSILVLFGMAMVSYPFIASMWPVEKIPEDAYKIDISNMHPNSSRLIITKNSQRIERETVTSWEPGGGLLVVRGEASDYYVYLVPIWEGKVMMPWRYWWQHEGYCPDFGLKKHDGSWVIMCATHNYDEFLTKQWYWSINGKNLGTDLPDLIRIHFAKDGDTLYVYEYMR